MHRLRAVLLSCLPVLTAVAAQADAGELPVVNPETVGLSAEKLKGIDGVVERAIEQQRTAGAVVLVLRKGKIAHFSAHGQQEIQKQSPMQRETIFRIYSMTKPITTVAAMMLWEQGRFDLDDPVAKFLPEFQDMKVHAGGEDDELKLVPGEREMTVRDLMRHTSGLTYGGGKGPVGQSYREADLRGRGLSLKEFTSEVAKLPLKYQPGTRFEYGYSTDVLGRLVEVWSGQPLDEFFQKRIFAPLDMHDTAFVVPDAKLDRFAANYGPNPRGGLRVIDAPGTSAYRKRPAMFSGGGGLVSTARDYARFMQMILGGGELDDRRLLKRETIDLMTRNHIPEDALPIVQGFPRVGWGFGLGWAVRVGEGAKEDPAPIGECRWGGAASTHFWFSWRDDVAVVVMQQHRPFIRILEIGIKPIVYDAIND